MRNAEDDRDDRGSGGATPPPRRRRARYPGTHPRRFGEKYKELAAQRYPEEIAKVRGRGQTPAGTHVPVLVDAVLDVLAPAAGAFALDCTLGHGGHAEAIARRLVPGGRLLALERDSDELELTRARLGALELPIDCVHANFAGAARVLRERGVDAVDVLLADLGVSSMQLDRPERGFSWKRAAPLDLRMDQRRGVPAAEWLATKDADELAALIAEHADEKDAAAIGAAIAARCRAGPPLRTTRDLTEVVLRAKGIDPRTTQSSAFDSHPAARTFQAVRIALNQEMEALDQLLRDLPWILRSGRSGRSGQPARPGGRAALISFHPGEARRIQAALARGVAAGLFRPGWEEAIAPSPAEVYDNPRARSARLHVAVRTDDA